MTVYKRNKYPNGMIGNNGRFTVSIMCKNDNDIIVMVNDSNREECDQHIKEA